MDAERFTDIFSRLQANLRRLALRIVGDEDEASDAVQDVFCTLWRKKDDVADNGSIEGMMAVSLRNRCLSEIRTRTKYQTDRLDDANGMKEEMSDIEESKEEEVTSLYNEVEAVMRRHLSERDREILIMRDKYEADFDEIAEKFDMTPAAVRMALSRARKNVLRAYRERNK